MNAYQREIIKFITEYLEANPEQRFGQALFNMNVTEFAVLPPDADQYLYVLRDIYNDSDDTILNRILNTKTK